MTDIRIICLQYLKLFKCEQKMTNIKLLVFDSNT